MKKTFETSLILLLVGMILMSTIHLAHAAIAPIDSVAWFKPAWKGKTDSVLGAVSVAYITNSQWMLKFEAKNNEYNSTDPNKVAVDVTVKNIAVWFDWNKFYNTTVNMSIKWNSSYIFIVNGTTEQTSIASNLFTHKYKIYVDYEFSSKVAGATATLKKTWTYVPSAGFAWVVLSQQQYDAAQTAQNYADFDNMVKNHVDDYAESFDLYVKAEMENSAAELYYNQCDFSSALQHYNTAFGLLNQSWTSYTSIKKEYDNTALEDKKADVDLKKANATATLIEANAIASSTIINSFAFILFGLGFMFFGIAAIFYARRPKTS